MHNSEQNHEDVTEEKNTEVSEGLDDYQELSQADDIELDVREAYEEAKSKLIKEEKDIDDGKADKTAHTEEKTEKVATAPSNDIKPPNDWDVKSKEWFQKQDPVVKKEIARRAKDLNDRILDVNNKWSGISKEYKEIDDAVTPYEDQFKAAGVSKSEGIKQLLAVNEFLKSDPIAGLEYLANTFNMTLEQAVEAKARGGGVAPLTSPKMDISKDPTVQELKNTVAFLLQERQQSALAPVVNSFREAGEKLQYETNANGEYLRPELHDDDFVRSLKPLVSGLQASEPTLSPEELLLRAYQARTGKYGVTETSFNKRNGNAARRATLSTRGSALSAPKTATKDVPDSIEEMNFQIARDLGLL